MKTVRIIASVIYGLLGTVFLVAGLAVLLVGTGRLPAAVEQAIRSEAGGNMDTLHIVQEFGTLMVFAGLVTWWFTWHYERSWFFHCAMTVFLGLLAMVHWIDVRGPNSSLTEPIPITVPFVVFVVLGVMRLATDSGSRASEANDRR